MEKECEKEIVEGTEVVRVVDPLPWKYRRSLLMMAPRRVCGWYEKKLTKLLRENVRVLPFIV